MLLSAPMRHFLVLISLASVSGMLEHITQLQDVSNVQHLTVSNDADQHLYELVNPEPVFFSPITNSNLPSSSPTESPTKSPTIGQTVIPTITHSNAPSSSPTESPTKSPTIGQTVIPTISKMSDKCNIENSGTFGETTADRESVTYYYEVETQGSPSLSEVLQSVENSIGNSILKEMYPECKDRRSLTNTIIGRRLGMTGISSSPSDKVTTGSCSTSPSNGNSCALVEGRMWVYFDSSGDDLNERTQILEIVKKGMESGSFDEADSSIVRVTYVNAPAYTDKELSAPGSTTKAQPAKNSLESRYIILMSFSVIAVAMGVVATRKFFKINTNLDDSNFSDLDNSDIMNPLSPSQEYSDGDSEMGSTSMIMSETTASSEFNDTSIIYDHRRKKTFDFGDVTIKEVELEGDSVEYSIENA